MSEIADRIENRSHDSSFKLEATIHDIISDLYNCHKRVIFGGNGYSEEWIEEAKKRGLPMNDSTVMAFKEYSDQRSIELFGKHGILNKIELMLREDINYLYYYNVTEIEKNIMLDMCRNKIIPAV